MRSAEGTGSDEGASVRSVAPAYRRVRRIAAAVLLVAGVIDLVSAVTPPLRDRIDSIRSVFPLAVPEIATALVAMAGIALMLLSRGVRKGQRLAWLISLAVLAASAILHLLKAGDIEEGLVAAGAATFLAVNYRAFGAAGDRPSLIKGVLTALAGGLIAVFASVIGIELFHRNTAPPVPISRAILVVSERLVGVYSTRLRPTGRGHFDQYVAPGLTAVGIALGIYALVLAFRPVVLSHHPAPGDYTRAREIIRQWGGDTLAYFALRDDKRWWFHGDSVVAYAVIGGICLVSPDPVGPPDERETVWTGFHTFADEHGWPVAVMGASEEWLPVYKAAGMRDLYVGDEAVVDCQTFKLEGGEMKGLRQAVNRIAKYGYRMEFYDPTEVGPELRAKLREVMAQNRRGDAERGFSMTLGRIFDPEDKGLLLAVAYGPDDEPAAFCHYVPAAAISGYSLDLMRRTDGPHPNGLIDFVVVRTIEHLRSQGMTGLGLNFATLRAVLAGETGDRVSQRSTRWLLRKMGGSMQIESLWKYNSKFTPSWRPRYAVYDSAENMLPAALAVARAESFFELPVIGRFLAADASRDPAHPEDTATPNPTDTVVAAEAEEDYRASAEAGDAGHPVAKRSR